MKFSRLLVLPLALALLPAARAQTPGAPSETDKTLARVEAAAQDWKAARDDARAMLAQVEKNTTDDWVRELAGRMRANAEAGELEQENLRHDLAAKIAADGKAGKLSDADVKLRVDAVSRLQRVRVYFLYGSVVPRAVEEAGARDSAGPSWRVRLSQPDFVAAQRALIERSGLPEDEFFKDFWKFKPATKDE